MNLQHECILKKGDLCGVFYLTFVIGKKSSIIMSTHSMEEDEILCQTIGIMVNGQLKKKIFQNFYYMKTNLNQNIFKKFNMFFYFFFNQYFKEKINM